jgi:transcriptional regulator with XRE-family HTH domain
MNPLELNRSVGLRILLRRERLGLTQEALAALAGMDRTAIGKIERGERGVTVGTLWRLAKALRTTSSQLLRGL